MISAGGATMGNIKRPTTSSKSATGGQCSERSVHDGNPDGTERETSYADGRNSWRIHGTNPRQRKNKATKSSWNGKGTVMYQTKKIREGKEEGLREREMQEAEEFLEKILGELHIT
jgi:hypothetical protein